MYSNLQKNNFHSITLKGRFEDVHPEELTEKAKEAAKFHSTPQVLEESKHKVKIEDTDRAKQIRKALEGKASSLPTEEEINLSPKTTPKLGWK